MGNSCAAFNNKQSNKEKAIRIFEEEQFQKSNNEADTNNTNNALLVENQHELYVTNSKLHELIKQANDNTESCKSKLISMSNDVDNLKNEILKQNRIIETLQSNIKQITQTTNKPISTIIHTGIKCDICGQYPIQGYRYKCSICSNWDCCSQCESKHNHPLIQLKNQSEYYEKKCVCGKTLTLTTTLEAYPQSGKRNCVFCDRCDKNIKFTEKLYNCPKNAKHKNGYCLCMKCSNAKTTNVNDESQNQECFCICGIKMKYIQSNIAYKTSNSIVCDGCRIKVTNTMVYHCPDEKNIKHKGGFDLCFKCSNKRILNSKKSVNVKVKASPIIENKMNVCECKGDDITDCASCNRLLTTMSQYKIDMKNVQYENNKLILNDFLHLLTEHNIDNNDQQFETITNALGDCDMNKCDIFGRNYRDRSKTIISAVAETEAVQERVWRQIFDRIHCHFSHCIDIGNRISLKKRQSLQVEQKDDDAENVCLVDKLMMEKYNIINASNKNTIKNYNNFNDRMKMKFVQFDKESDDIKQDANKQTSPGMYSFGTKFNYGYGKETWDKNAVVVTQKYSSLKEELTTNKISSISIKQFMTETQKAMYHFDSDYCKKQFNSDFVFECVLALMMYCNYDVMQYQFSKTYRDNQDQHNNYYHLGKYLKMAITLNGTRCTIENIRKPFYHGIGQELLFPEYIGSKAKGVVINGPLSTSTSFDVATNFTNGNNGLIIQFGYKKVNYNESPRYFSVAFLSDFSNEAEHLFIQSNKHVSLKIQNIFDAKQGCQFEPIINVLTIIEQVTSSGIFYGGLERMISNDIPKKMKKFAKTILQKRLSKTTFVDLTEYANKMIQTYCDNKKTIHIDYTKLNSKYSFVKTIFCHEKYKWIKTNDIKKIFPNIDLISLSGFQALSSVKMDDIVNNLKTNNKIATIWNTPHSFKHKVQYIEAMNTIYGNKPCESMQVLNALKTFDDILYYKHRTLENISLEKNKLIMQIINRQLSQLSDSDNIFSDLSENLVQIIETFFQYKTSIAINCDEIKTKCSFLIDVLFEKNFDCIKLQQIMTIFPNLKEIIMCNVNLKLEVFDNIVTFLSNENKLKTIIMYASKSSDCSVEYVNNLYKEQLSKINYDIQALFSWNSSVGITIKQLNK